MQAHLSSFGQLLRQARLAQQRSQQDLANASKLDRTTVSRYEAGRRAPDRSAIEALATALGVTEVERDRWLAAAGYLPGVLHGIDPGDPHLRLLARLLSGELEPSLERQVRGALQLIALGALGERARSLLAPRQEHSNGWP